MKPEEVMVGNYVYDTWDDEVRQIYPVDVLNIENGRDIFEPIKITREWLDKLGFKMEQKTLCVGNVELTDEPYFVKDNIRVYEVFANKPCWQIRVGNQFVPRIIEYVHELQIACVAFTGNQLTTVTDK